MRLLAIWTGKALIWLLRRRGSGGSALPGLVIEKIYPSIINKLVADLPDGAIMVTGTNGKTTTAKIIRTLLVASGREVIANRAGSNMSRGIASALVEHCSWRGQLQGGAAVFEVDEAFIPDVARKVNPKVMVVLNLARDQLDRYGELDRTARLIAEGLKYADQAVLNGDDPLVAELARDLNHHKITYFGAVEQLRQQLPVDTELHGKRERQKIIHEPDFQLIESRGRDRGKVRHKSAPSQVIKVKHQGSEYAAELKLSGVFNAYNAIAALAACVGFGLKVKPAIKALTDVKPAFGRSEMITYQGKTLQLLLVKNPAGLNQVIETFLRNNSGPILFAINDYFADGRDVSWLWDVDFERLEPTDRSVLSTGTRGYDLALRLQYAELTSDVELDLTTAMGRFAKGLESNQVGYVVPTYTALLALRKLIAREENIEEIWR